MTLIWSSISNWYSRIEFIKSTSHKQLELELSPLEQFFLNQLSITSDPLTVTVAAYAIGLLQEARDELKNRRAQNAWALFYRAELEQYKLFGDREINARAGKILFQSASKLEDGAKQNVRRLIGVDSQNGDWKLKNPLERDSVVEARRIVQEYYTDKYTCLGLTFPQLFVFGCYCYLYHFNIDIYFTRHNRTNCLN
jgi:hypothetical protein